MTTKTCETCEHSTPHDGTVFVCRRYPPTPTVIDGGVEYLLPIVLIRCGEHKPKAVEVTPAQGLFIMGQATEDIPIGSLVSLNPASGGVRIAPASEHVYASPLCPYCGDPLELVRPGKHQPTGCCERAEILEDVARDMLADLVNLGLCGHGYTDGRLDRYKTRMAEATAEWAHK